MYETSLNSGGPVTNKFFKQINREALATPPPLEKFPKLEHWQEQRLNKKKLIFYSII